jgi:hypothetical protein
MSIRSGADDTSAEARDVMRQAYARMSPSEKIDRLRSLTLAANRLALAGLRSRHPEESERSLLLRLAKIRLGDALAARVYRDERSASDA